VNNLAEIDESKEIEIFKDGFLTAGNYREKVTEAEELILSLPQLDIPVQQHFAPGVYTREITIPKDAILTGSLHKFPHVVVVLSGEIIVATDNGLQRIEAPCSFVAPPGVKRIAICIEECRWMTVHSYFGDPLPEEDMKQVIGCDNYAAYEIWLAQQDFNKFVEETGLSGAEIRMLVSEEGDIAKDSQEISAKVDVSKISGFGMFSGRDFKQGETIGNATVAGLRTILGRFVNHSPFANLVADDVDGDFVFKASRNIREGEELIVNYRQVNSLRSQE